MITLNFEVRFKGSSFNLRGKCRKEMILKIRESAKETILASAQNQQQFDLKIKDNAQDCDLIIECQEKV